jgi:hypothetical protein
VALNASERRVRFGSCKRSAERLVADIAVLDGHVRRFLVVHPRFSTWTIEKVGLAPTIAADVRARLHAAGHLAQDLGDLTAELR